jgi:hypothetical protein
MQDPCLDTILGSTDPRKLTEFADIGIRANVPQEMLSIDNCGPATLLVRKGVSKSHEPPWFCLC